MSAHPPSAGPPSLARRLGLFDVTMIVMGGIVGSGIFINPYVVARQVHSPLLILGAWLAGGLIALVGAFAYAELAARLPAVGGQYAYIREAFHPAFAFVYGWGLLLVTQTGGMAAVAVTFAHYFLELTRLPLASWFVAALALAILTLLNCMGVRAGSSIQNVLMLLKIAAIAALVCCGLLLAPKQVAPPETEAVEPASFALWAAFGAALMPVLFAYGGWQTASFVATEIREPRRTLPRGLLIGVTGVVILYLAVNYACVRVLGPAGLAGTTTPASAVMRAALGESGANLIAVGIAVSTLGFLSQSILTAPRVYFAMARDGVFFQSVARVHPRTRVPVIAIALQGVFAAVIAVSGRYEQILSYVVSVDWIFFSATVSSLFVFRKRLPLSGGYSMPGYPWTAVLFVAAGLLVVLATVYRYPVNSAVGIVILCAGFPAYLCWRRRSPTTGS
jgi:APA family basic amino acid/polyamine antiporter